MGRNRLWLAQAELLEAKAGSLLMSTMNCIFPPPHNCRSYSHRPSARDHWLRQSEPAERARRARPLPTSYFDRPNGREREKFI